MLDKSNDKCYNNNQMSVIINYYLEVYNMATIQIRVDEHMKAAADSLFSDLGLDTSTAVRMFITAALEHDGIPFAIKRARERKPNAELREAMEDVRLNRNLYGPFKTAEEAVRSMLED
jgi:DNA-damage-inducible protein J